MTITIFQVKYANLFFVDPGDAYGDSSVVDSAAQSEYGRYRAVVGSNRSIDGLGMVISLYLIKY